MESNISRIIFNYIARLVSIGFIIILTPLYINYLGVESYAIISFYTILLGVIGFADAGLSSATIKEFSTDKDSDYKYSVLRNIEKVYILICIGIFIIIFLSSDFIGYKWLRSASIPPNLISYYVKLVGAGISLQLLSSLYYGALFGQGKQTFANILQISWNVCRSALVILFFIFYKSSLEFFLIWQIVCNSLYIILLRFTLIRQLRSVQGKVLTKIDNKLPRHIITYISGMSVIAIISSVNIQIDKIVVSFNFSLEQLGYYNIASIIGQTPIIICTPIMLFAFPIFARYSHDSVHNKVISIVFKKVYVSILFLAGILLISVQFYIKEFILMWMGKKGIVDLDALIIIARLLILGSFFMTLQMPFFYFLLAKGKTKYTIVQGLAQLILGVPLLYFGIKKFGIVGVAVPWIVTNLGAYLYLMNIVCDNYLPSLSIRFSILTSIKALLLISITFVPGYIMYQKLNFHFIVFIILSFILLIGALLLLIRFFYGSDTFKTKLKNIINLPN